MRFAYWATIHPSANTPTPASSTASGADVPAPRAAAFTPMISGMMNAAENTGPMNPTDWATTSTRVSFFSTQPFVSRAPAVGPPLRSPPSPFGHRRQAAAPCPVHPSAGRSNHTCTWPVPTDASYSLNSSPGAWQRAPPIADAIIR